ncbi:MAG: hypothetical protein AAGN46_06700 [Acidobacteriota bacterium]
MSDEHAHHEQEAPRFEGGDPPIPRDDGQNVPLDAVTACDQAAEAGADDREGTATDFAAIEASPVTTLSSRDFESHVGTSFVLHVEGGGSMPLKLVAVDSHGDAPPSLGDGAPAPIAPFAAVFEAADGETTLPAGGIFRLEHAELGEMSLYFEEVVSHADGTTPQIEAVFS